MTGSRLAGHPNFVIAGAARSGTTALTEALRAHPDVFVTQPKEPHYFAFAGQEVAFTGPYDEATINRVAVTDTEQYLSLYAGGGHCSVRGEGSVSTLYHHDTAVPEILRINPTMRVVIMLRDPVERAFSSYQYLRARGFEPEENFPDAVRAEPRRIHDGWQHLFHYTAMSTYADAVEHFRTALPPEHVGIWFYEDFIADGPSVVSQVCAFLGLDPTRLDEQAVPRVNVSGQPRSRSLQALIQRVSRSRQARELVKKVVPFSVRERVRRANLKASGVPADVRTELAPVFAADLAKLAEVVDQPLPRWNHA